MNPLPIQLFEPQTDALLALLRRFVEIESPSSNKQALDQMGTAIVAALQDLNPQITIDSQPETGDNIVAHWPAAGGRSDGGVVILCHFDTVHDVGELAVNPPRLENGVFYGPGALDMKASIVQVIFGLRVLKAQNRWPQMPITVLFTSDEEVGSRSGRPLVEHHSRNASMVLCMEPGLPNGSVKTWRKGVGNFVVVAHGQAAHAGAAHQNGVNALEEAAHQILALQRMTDYEQGTTVNVGIVQGGTRANVVPDYCRMLIDVRVMTPENGARIEAAILGLQPRHPAARLEISGNVYRPPMLRTEHVLRAYSFAQAVGQHLGLEIDEGGTGGGSDINWVAHLPIALLDGLGPLGLGAHTHHEALEVASLIPRTALLAGILSEWQG